jgi:hypothetical protein
MLVAADERPVQVDPLLLDGFIAFCSLWDRKTFLDRSHKLLRQDSRRHMAERMLSILLSDELLCASLIRGD